MWGFLRLGFEASSSNVFPGTTTQLSTTDVIPHTGEVTSIASPAAHTLSTFNTNHPSPTLHTSSSFLRTTSTSTSTSIAISSSSPSRPSTADFAGVTTLVVKHSSGYSGGALAGAIVGSVIGGIFLTVLAISVFRYMQKSRDGSTRKRRRRLSSEQKEGAQYRRSGSHHSSNSPKSYSVNKALPPVSQEIGATAFDHAFNVPQPADDRTVADKMLVVFNGVGLHVENYYAPISGPFTVDPSLIAEYDSPYLPTPVADLMSDPHNQIAVITHCLMRVILNGILPHMDMDGTLFLPPLCSAYTSPQKQNPDPGTDRVFFSWRMLTTLVQRELLADDHAFMSSRDRRIRSAAHGFSRAFAPYASQRYSEDQRTSHLINVMQHATDLGVWLFAEPCGFDFEWYHSSEMEIVVTPAVTKRFNEKGERLAVAQTVVEAKRERC